MAKIARWREKEAPFRLAPEKMTLKDFKKWKRSPAGIQEKKRLEEISELRSMPAWLTFRSIWVGKSEAQIDAMTRAHIKREMSPMIRT